MVDRERVEDARRPSSVENGGLFEPLRKRRHHRHSSGPRWLRHLRRQVRRFPLRRLLLVIAGVIAVLVVVGLALVSDAQTRVATSSASLERVLNTIRLKPGTELTLTDFERLRASVTDLERTLSLAKTQTAFLRPLTSFSSDAQIQLSLLDIGSDLVQAGQDILTGVEPTLFFLVGGQADDTVVTQISSGERVVELLGLGRGRFMGASERLARAKAALTAIDLGSATPDVILTLQQLTRTHEELAAISRLLLSAPELLNVVLGLDEDQTYLILAQNSDELRPSGGYISSYGWMVMRNGRVVNYDYSATTATSPTPPTSTDGMPYAVPDWWLQFREPIYAAWDGSWSPDFPTTAEMAMWYYNAGENSHAPVTGTIAIDIVGFQTILEALGPVDVPEFDVRVDGQNFRDVIYTIRAGGSGDLAHKRFLVELYKRIFEEWQSVSDLETSSSLMGAMLQGLQEQHIQLHFSNPELNESLEQLGWSGSQGSGRENDYLMVVDANLGNKSNRSVIRQLTYDVDITAEGSVQSRATVSYDYPASLADNDPAVDPEHHGPLNYRTLLQVIGPADAQSVTSASDEHPYRVVDQSEHTLITTQFTVPYDQTARVQYAYTTPDLIETFGPYQRYRLHIDKQPGTLNEAVSVQLALPPGASIVSVDPVPAASYDIDRPILEFRLQATRDQWVEVVYFES